MMYDCEVESGTVYCEVESGTVYCEDESGKVYYEVESCTVDSEQPSPVGVTIFDLQPNLEQIFSYLSLSDKGRVAQVCIDWRNAVYLPSLWKNVEVKVRLDEKLDENEIASLAERRIENVRVLNLKSHHLFDVMEGVPSLKSLSLGRSEPLTDMMLSYSFFGERANLTSLDFTNCDIITDLTMTLVARNFPNLSSLNLDSCCRLTDTSLAYIAHGLTNLKTFRLWNCDAITDAGIGYLAGEDRHEAAGIVQLERFSFFCKKLTNATLEHIGRSQKDLTHLEFQVYNFTAAGMTHFSDLKQLSSLALEGGAVSDAWLSRLSSGEWNISCLELRNVVHKVQNAFSILAGLASFERLVFRNCSGIVETGLCLLVQHGSKITHLTVDVSTDIGDKDFKLIAGLTVLRKLELRKCINVTNLGLENLAEGASKIDTLFISGCSKIGPAGLRIIASGLLNLRFLDLEQGYVSEQGLILACLTLLELVSLVAGGRELIGEIRNRRKGNSKKFGFQQ